MTDPWSTLGVPQGSGREQVRAAYAKLLRQHRPDVDPVGFRRIRDAYEALLHGNSHPEWSWPFAVPVPTPSPTGSELPAAREMPEDLIGSFLGSAGGAAAAGEDPAAARRLPPQQRAWRALIRARRHPARLRRVRLRILAMARCGQSGLLALALGDPEAFSQLPSFTTAELEALVATGNLLVLESLLNYQLRIAERWPEAERLLCVLLAKGPQLQPAMRGWLRRVAVMVAVVEPMLAERCLDLAFDPTRRVGWGDDAEVLVAIGKELRQVPLPGRTLVQSILVATRESVALERLAAAAQVVGSCRALAPLLHARFLHLYPQSAEGVARAAATVPPLPAQGPLRPPLHGTDAGNLPSPGGSLPIWGLVLVVLVMVLGIVTIADAVMHGRQRRLERDSRRTPPAVRFVNPRPDLDPLDLLFGNERDKSVPPPPAGGGGR